MGKLTNELNEIRRMLKEFVIPEVYDKVIKKVRSELTAIAERTVRKALSMSSYAFNEWMGKKKGLFDKSVEYGLDELEDDLERERREEMKPVEEKDSFRSQTLEEQVWVVLNYIKLDPKQTLVPDGRLELLKKTLKEKCKQRQEVHDRVKGSYVSGVYVKKMHDGEFVDLEIPILKVEKENDGFMIEIKA